MNRLGFRCSYTTVKDVEQRSPCGGRAVRRKRGDPRCLGHWVIEWLVAAYGGGNPDRARSVYGSFFTVWFLLMLGSGIQSAVSLSAGNNLEYTVAQTGLYFCVAGVSGGIALGFTLEHQFGGRIWLTFAPLSSLALLLQGRIYLSGAAPSSASRLADILTAFADFVIALAVLAGWLVFLLESVRRYRLATCLSIFTEVLAVVLVLTGIGLALASQGANSSLLVMTVVLIGLATVVRGVARLKKLARILRV